MKRAVAQLNLSDLALLRGDNSTARRYLTESLAKLEQRLPAEALAAALRRGAALDLHRLTPADFLQPVAASSLPRSS